MRLVAALKLGEEEERERSADNSTARTGSAERIYKRITLYRGEQECRRLKMIERSMGELRLPAAALMLFLQSQMDYSKFLQMLWLRQYCPFLLLNTVFYLRRINNGGRPSPTMSMKKYFNTLTIVKLQLKLRL